MFELEKAIDAWCNDVQGDDCGNRTRGDELADHLYCEIGRFQDEGLSDEAAFQKATAKLGKVDDLREEYAKNNGKLSFLCASEAAYAAGYAKYGLSPRMGYVITIGHALLFAAAMLIASFVIEDSGTSTTVVLGVILPLWFATWMMLPGTRESMQAELTFLKRKLR